MGERTRENWRGYCDSNHKAIKGPIEGWGGVKGGVMTLGEGEKGQVKFDTWLAGIERHWKKVTLQ